MSFRLFLTTTVSFGDRVPPGKYTVTIVAAYVLKNDQDFGVSDLPGGKYSTPEKSSLKVKMQDKSIEIPSYDLKSK